MNDDEIRSEHVMIRLKPSERALLEERAKKEHVKPTQLAYRALLNALESKYSLKELGDFFEKHSKRLDALEAKLPSKKSSK